MNQLQTIKKTLTGAGAISAFADALPQTNAVTAKKAAERFSMMVYTQVSLSPQLQKCSPQSLIKAACISASLGLDMYARELAQFVSNNIEAQFTIGYLGLIELAYRSGKVKSISANVIYESEKANVTIKRIDGQYSVEHPFSFDKPSGDIVAVYATANVEGLGAQTIVLRKDEIEHARTCSKAKNSPAWTSHYEAMAKKTAIRQLAKFLPKSILDDFTRGAALDEQEDFNERMSHNEADKLSKIASEPIDVQFDEPTPEEETEAFGEGEK